MSQRICVLCLQRKSAAMEAIREGRVVIGDIDAEEYVPVTKQGDLSHYTSVSLPRRLSVCQPFKGLSVFGWADRDSGTQCPCNQCKVD
jgi:hypothetical protein